MTVEQTVAGLNEAAGQAPPVRAEQTRIAADSRNFWERLGTRMRDGDDPNPTCEYGPELATTYWTDSEHRRHPVCQWHWDVFRGHRLHSVIARDPEGGHVSASVTCVHARSCPYWRMGKRHGPCSCGAHETWHRMLTMGEVDSNQQLWELVARLAPRP